MALVVGGVTVTGTQTLDASKLTGTASAINGSNITNLPAPSTANVLSATAGLTAGNTGTYMLAVMQSWAQETFAATEAGSNLGPCNVAGTGENANNTRSGTWRCMGSTVGSADASYNATVWLRIS